MNNLIKLIKIIIVASKKYGFKSIFHIFIIAINSILSQDQHKNYKFLCFSINSPKPRLLLALLNEIFINDEYLIASKTVKKDSPIIFDCGTNIGISLLYWKYIFNNPKIIAFEPFLNFIPFIKLNSSNNNIDVKIENVALGKDDTGISFFLDDENLTTGSTSKSRGGKIEYKVNQRKLSNYFNEFEYIDLVKMDIEGAEFDVLNDLISKNLILKCETYIIEFHLQIGNKECQQNFTTIINMFTSLNYNFTLKSSNFKIYGFQDILLYFKKI